MVSGKAVVRQHIEKIDGVSSTWIEWESDSGLMIKRLVVEVDFDTDPNSPTFRPSTLDAIETTAKDVLREETTMAISNISIVPKGRH